MPILPIPPILCETGATAAALSMTEHAFGRRCGTPRCVYVRTPSKGMRGLASASTGPRGGQPAQTPRKARSRLGVPDGRATLGRYCVSWRGCFEGVMRPLEFCIRLLVAQPVQGCRFIVEHRQVRTRSARRLLSGIRRVFRANDSSNLANVGEPLRKIPPGLYLDIIFGQDGHADRVEEEVRRRPIGCIDIVQHVEQVYELGQACVACYLHPYDRGSEQFGYFEEHCLGIHKNRTRGRGLSTPGS